MYFGYGRGQVSDEAGDVVDKIGIKRSCEIWEVLLVGEFSTAIDKIYILPFQATDSHRLPQTLKNNKHLWISVIVCGLNGSGRRYIAGCHRYRTDTVALVAGWCWRWRGWTCPSWALHIAADLFCDHIIHYHTIIGVSFKCRWSIKDKFDTFFKIDQRNQGDRR